MIVRPIRSVIRRPIVSAMAPGVGGGAAWSPLIFFSGGEQGGWYDPSDLSTLFQDAAGTTPVTAAGQTVKRWNDKSGRGNHMSNAAATWTYQVDAAGKPYVQTDGTTRLNLVSGTTLAWGAGTATIVVSYKPTTAGQSRTIVGFGNVSNTVGTWSFESISGGPLVYRRGSGSFGGNSSASVSTTTTTFCATIDLSGTTHATETENWRVNGSSPALTNYGATDTGTGNFGSNDLRIAGGGTNPSSFWSGRIYQIIVSAKKATLAELQLAETYSGDKAGYAVPFVAAASPVWLDTFSPVTESGFVRTSPFSRAKYTTTAEAVTVSGYTDVSASFPTMDQFAVYVDGVYSTAFNPTANGAFNGTLSLSAGTKTIEFVSGLQAAPSQTNVLGTWFTGATASAAMTAVTDTTTNRLVIYGDSIAVGANSTVPPKDGWPVLLRAERGTDSTVVEAYGFRSLNLDASDATKRAAFVAKIVALNPSILWMAIGTNDYGLTKWTDSAFGTAYGAFLDDIHAALPSLVIYCQTPILRSGEPTANGNGLFLSDFRTAISNAVSTRSAWATLVDGTAILTTAQLDDGVHPSTAGHIAYAAYVAGVLGV
jgi:lysophospholipase L1-like esterase